MSSINGINGSNPLNRIANKPVAPTTTSTPSSAPRGTDTVELGQQFLSQLKTNDVRVDKVAEIKAQIAAGTYETDERINGAVDKLLDEVV